MISGGKLIRLNFLKSVSANPTKKVRHSQTTRRLLPTNCLSVFDHSVDLSLKGLTCKFVDNS